MRPHFAPLPGWAPLAVAAVFGGVAAFLWADPIGYSPPADDAPELRKEYYSKTPPRRIRGKLMFDGMECSICHDGSEPLEGNPVEKGIFHETISLKHGRNNRCFNCHHTQKLDFFARHDGQPIPYNEVQLLCGKCHGTILRDWKAGAHGRRNGYWDKKSGKQKTVLCIACHHPHEPQFKTIEAAPRPRINPRAPATAGAQHGEHG